MSDDTCDDSTEVLRAKVALLGWRVWGRGSMWYADSPNENSNYVNAVEKIQIKKTKTISFDSERSALQAVIDYTTILQDRS